MSIVKKFLLGLVVLIALLLVIGFFLPSTAHVERTAKIGAPPHVVYTLINNFRSFNNWSPWAERDPETAYTFEGPEAGVGAKMTWASDNPQVGSGFQQITASEPYNSVLTHLDFGSQGTAEAFFRLEPADSGTSVTWGFDTDFGFNLVSRYMGLMFDRWIGADYEAGLANLKSLAEGLPSTDWTDLEIEVVELAPAVMAYTAGRSSLDGGAIGQALAAAYGEIGGFVARENLQITGPPVAITTSSNDEEWNFDAGIPIAEIPDLEIDPDSPVQIRETRGGKTIRAVNIGSYTNISTSWKKLFAFVEVSGYQERDAVWEEYVSDPGSTPEEELITRLHIPVQ